jgi:hypothetical protein
MVRGASQGHGDIAAGFSSDERALTSACELLRVQSMCVSPSGASHLTRSKPGSVRKCWIACVMAYVSALAVRPIKSMPAHCADHDHV